MKLRPTITACIALALTAVFTGCTATPASDTPAEPVLTVTSEVGITAALTTVDGLTTFIDEPLPVTGTTTETDSTDLLPTPLTDTEPVSADETEQVANDAQPLTSPDTEDTRAPLTPEAERPVTPVGGLGPNTVRTITENGDYSCSYNNVWIGTVPSSIGCDVLFTHYANQLRG